MIEIDVNEKGVHGLNCNELYGLSKDIKVLVVFPKFFFLKVCFPCWDNKIHFRYDSSHYQNLKYLHFTLFTTLYTFTKSLKSC